MKFLPNTPSGADLFDGRPLERVSHDNNVLKDIDAASDDSEFTGIYKLMI